MRDDERTPAERAGSPEGARYRPWGALAVTVFLAAVIVGLWFLVFAISQVRG
ncbi:MAG TPA: cytochrome c oxidase subunit 2A [Trueperaceae bacterium]|nr:cytochrome c oxidase subunit 2A [Trueperaceae bacterium]